MRPRTKIVATIGPASDDFDTLCRMIDAGMDVARFGFAHASVDHQLERIDRLRKAAEASDRIVGVLADLPGPKIRAGELPEGGVFLAEGLRIALVPSHDVSTAERIAVEYDALLDDLHPGDWVSLGDGGVRLLVDEVGEWAAHTTVLHGGRVQGRPGVHLPAERLRADVPTAEDLQIIKQLSGDEIDILAVSFVRRAADLERTRQALAESGSTPLVMAKIETRAAVAHLDEIVDEADALMVARGDLGVECALEEVPHLQKRIVRTCVAFGRPVVTATEMLESMVQSPTPTRAEATDVANAVFDGTDAVMLSAETAIGHDPVLVIQTMARIAGRAEREADYVQWGGRLGKLQRQSAVPPELELTGAITHAAWQAAHEAGATAILCCSRTGLTVRAMARFRPTAHLIGLTPRPQTARQLTLTWGAQPVITQEHSSQEDVVTQALARATEAGLLHNGDVAAVLTGDPRTGGIDALRLVRVGA